MGFKVLIGAVIILWIAVTIETIQKNGSKNKKYNKSRDTK